MRLLYSILGWALVTLGGVHMLATLHFFKSLTSGALWFFSGGIAICLTGALNLLHRSYGRLAPGLKWVCVCDNVVMAAFSIVGGVVGHASPAQFVLVLGVLSGATALSLSSKALYNAQPVS